MKKIHRYARHLISVSFGAYYLGFGGEIVENSEPSPVRFVDGNVTEKVGRLDFLRPKVSRESECDFLQSAGAQLADKAVKGRVDFQTNAKVKKTKLSDKFDDGQNKIQ